MSHIPKPLGVLREKNGMQQGAALPTGSEEPKLGPKRREGRESSGGGAQPRPAVVKAALAGRPEQPAGRTPGVELEPSQTPGSEQGGERQGPATPHSSIPAAPPSTSSFVPQRTSFHGQVSSTSSSAATCIATSTGTSIATSTSTGRTSANGSGSRLAAQSSAPVAALSPCSSITSCPSAPQPQPQPQVPAAGRPSFRSHIPTTAAKPYMQSQVSLVSPDRSNARTGTRAQQRQDQLFAQKAIAEEYNTVVPAVRGAAAEEEALEALALRLIAEQRARWLALVIENVQVQVQESIAAALAEEEALVPPGQEEEEEDGEAAGPAGAGPHVGGPLEPLYPAVRGGAGAAAGGVRGYGRRNPEGMPSTQWPLPDPGRSGAGGGSANPAGSRIGSGAAVRGGSRAGARSAGDTGTGSSESDGAAGEFDGGDDGGAAGRAAAAVMAGAKAGGRGVFPSAAVAVAGGGASGEKGGAVVAKPPRVWFFGACCMAPRAL